MYQFCNCVVKGCLRNNSNNQSTNDDENLYQFCNGVVKGFVKTTTATTTSQQMRIKMCTSSAIASSKAVLKQTTTTTNEDENVYQFCNCVVKGCLGQATGAIRRVQDLVIEHGEVEGESQAGKNAKCKLGNKT